MPTEEDPRGLARALGPVGPRMTPPAPVPPRRLAIWALVAALAVGLAVANVLVLLSRSTESRETVPGTVLSAPSPAASPSDEVSTLPRPLAAYVFPGSVGSYIFVSKGNIGDDEVGYYSRGKEALLIHKNARTELRELAAAATDVARTERFWCWSTQQGEQQCGAQLRDGVVLLVARESPAAIKELMSQALRGI